VSDFAGITLASVTAAVIDASNCRFSFRLRGSTTEQSQRESLAEFVLDLERRLQNTNCRIALRQAANDASVTVRGTLPLSQFLQELGRLAMVGSLVAIYAQMAAPPARPPVAAPESPS